MNCVYCDSADVQARKISENQFAWAVPTNMPITPGHTLVLPKRHVAALAELSNEELIDIFSLALAVEKALTMSFGRRVSTAHSIRERSRDRASRTFISTSSRVPRATAVSRNTNRESFCIARTAGKRHPNPNCWLSRRRYAKDYPHNHSRVIHTPPKVGYTTPTCP